MEENLKDFKFEVLQALDIRAEYTALGVEVVDATPSERGWLSCRAFGKEDRNPSAGINIAKDSPAYGRYKEFVGEGLNVTLYDFAIHSGKFKNFTDALKYYAHKAGKSLPRGRRPAGPETELEFHEWNRDIVATWCNTKPPITPQAVQINGGKFATYHSKFGKFQVVALPFYGINLLDAGPTGWAHYSVSGSPLPVSQGKDHPPRMVKVKTTLNSTSGFLGRFCLSKLDSAEVIWKVEGVSDMLALQSAILNYSEKCTSCSSGCANCHNGKIYPYSSKHFVLTNSGGAAEFPTDKYTLPLKGKKVIIVHDRDESGEIGEEKWFSGLARVAAECKVIHLPFAFQKDHGKDLRDYLTGVGNNYKALLDYSADPNNIAFTSAKGALALCKPSPETQERIETRSAVDEIESLALDRRICEVIGIQVVGEDDSMGVEVFSIKHGKTTVIKNVSFLTIEQLIQTCGEQVIQSIHFGRANEPIPNMYHISRVRQAIATLGGYHRSNNMAKSGVGCWQGMDSKRKPNDSVVVVGGQNGLDWNSKDRTHRVIRQPIWGGMVLDFRNEDSWYSHDLLSTYLAQSSSQDWCKKIINELETIFSNWHWTHPKYTPLVLTGLVLSSWVQTLWHWRPLVAITGASDSGKTTLFESLESIFGGLSIRSSRSTEAGIRQAIGNTGSILLCDEFESDVHRQRILELFRTSTKGDKTLRGTTDQKGNVSGLRHICWVAAIESGLRAEPDRNRFIQFEMKKPIASKRGKMNFLPLPFELADMGMKLLAIAIRHIHRARELADSIRDYKHERIDGRVIESYAIPLSMLAAVMGGDGATARGYMDRVIEEIQTETKSSSDEIELLSDVFSSLVDIGGGKRLSVSEILNIPFSGDSTSITMLATRGVSRVSGPKTDGATKGRSFLFVSPKNVVRYLLQGTPWADKDIGQIISRIPGAERCRHRAGGHLQDGVRIPYQWVVANFLGDSDTPNDGTVEPPHEDSDVDPGSNSEATDGLIGAVQLDFGIVW